jgi:hypothetical protein
MMSPDKVVWNCSAFELKPEISSKLYQPLTISEEPSGSPNRAAQAITEYFEYAGIASGPLFRLRHFC